MIKIKKLKIPLPGYRNIKTALACFVCIIFYLVYQGGNSLISLSSALICMEDSVEGSIKSGINRILGTIIGGIFGLGVLLLGRFFNIGVRNMVWALIACIGLVIFIHVLNLLKKNNSIIIGCIVYLIIVLDPSVSNPFDYAFRRFLDTAVGIIVAVVINHFLFRPESEREENSLESQLFNYKVIRECNHKKRTWKGGVFKELIIYPEKFLFNEAKFNWRISISTTDLNETFFTMLKDYKWHIMPLNSSLKISQNENIVTLNSFDMYSFNASLKTKGVGLSTDFNLVTSKDYDGYLEKYCSDYSFCINPKDNSIYRVICSLVDHLTIAVKINDDLFEVILNKYDIFLFENINTINDETFTLYTKEIKISEVVAIGALVRKIVTN